MKTPATIQTFKAAALALTLVIGMAFFAPSMQARADAACPRRRRDNSRDTHDNGRDTHRNNDA